MWTLQNSDGLLCKVSICTGDTHISDTGDSYLSHITSVLCSVISLKAIYTLQIYMTLLLLTPTERVKKLKVIWESREMTQSASSFWVNKVRDCVIWSMTMKIQTLVRSNIACNPSGPLDIHSQSHSAHPLLLRLLHLLAGNIHTAGLDSGCFYRYIFFLTKL